jgi:urease accessory protein
MTPNPSLTSDQRLALAHLTSPAFPTGAFAWSQGLETAVRDGQVRDAASLADWLSVLLALGTGRTDAILIAAAAGADAAEAAALSDLAIALACTRARRAELRETGAAFAAGLRSARGIDLPDLAYPVALGRAAGLLDLPPLPVAELHLLGVVTTLVQAAQRLMPLGQGAAHRVIAAALPEIAAVAAEAVMLTPDDIGGCALVLDIAAMRHETQAPRLFRS